MKKILILGGMGPVAAHHIFGKILHYVQQRYGAIQDTDYPEILIDNIGLVDFNETGVASNTVVLEQLLRHIKHISSYHNGSDSIIGIACNTVHIFYDELQSVTAAPIIHLPRAVIASVAQDGHKRVGILASNTTIEQGLYTREMDKNDIHYLVPTPEEQTVITSVIKNVMGGDHTYMDREKLSHIAHRFHKEGCSAVILGCTELPVAMEGHTLNIAEYSSNAILAKVLVENARK